MRRRLDEKYGFSVTFVYPENVTRLCYNSIVHVEFFFIPTSPTIFVFIFEHMLAGLTSTRSNPTM
jgi:hypothetical protein